MSRKGENIYKRKDGRWEGRYIQSRDFSGKAKYGYVYARTYRESKNRLIERQTANNAEHWNLHHTQYNNVLDRWLLDNE